MFTQPVQFFRTSSARNRIGSKYNFNLKFALYEFRKIPNQLKCLSSCVILLVKVRHLVIDSL